MTHPLIDTIRVPHMAMDDYLPHDGAGLDGTPFTLALILLGAAGVLGIMKMAGFRFVIGVG